MDKPKKFIDIYKVIYDKSPRLAKVLPRFVIRYLKRVIHEDAINKGLNEYGHKRNLEFLEEVFKMLDVSYTIEGLDDIDPNERYVFASNHPLGGLDGMVLIHSLLKKFGSIKVPSNDLLMNISQLQDSFIPVNKHGGQPKAIALLMEKTYASDVQLFNFPAGLCSRKQNGVIQDLDWKKTFIAKAVKHKRSVVPIFFYGKNSNFFYNLSRIRKFLRIKLNIEMLYLVDEMFKQKGKCHHVIVGKPIPYTTFDSSRTPTEWAAWVKTQTYELNKKQE